MVNKEFTYYRIEWVDGDGDTHTDFYMPTDIPLPSVSFYHKCDDPRAEVLGFMNKLIKYDLFPFTMDKDTVVATVREQC